jgi:signal transduction histidine kinase
LIKRLDTIQSSVSALSAQIEELHDATRLQAGRALDLFPRPTDLVALARECVLKHQPMSESHTLRVESDVPELVGTWDAARLERVLANLVANAIKYSPAGGDVLVRVGRDADSAVVSVTDRGIGIPAADVPHIFEHYRRASNVAGQIAGSGLGLAGARDIIRQHGGAITVESEEGRGTTFLVRLPRSVDRDNE